MTENNRVYSYWNGKNIHGKSYVGDPNSIEAINKEDDLLMKYVLGVDTFSADDLQPGVEYDESE